ncbi:hypothetical protein [Saccharothrix deserti]|uniref:hypothetical protein n=1 Tax=Saccharothrix deserti TaxID=2593674 RepID=UPI00131E7D16|nr:hypothetical protein [Saccharothrix deserti]
MDPGRQPGQTDAVRLQRRGANPFHISGGPVSIYGERVVNFAHQTAMPVLAPPGDEPPVEEAFAAEVFLVVDTGWKDSSGRGVVDVFGGFTWGWQIRRVPAG